MCEKANFLGISSHTDHTGRDGHTGIFMNGPPSGSARSPLSIECIEITTLEGFTLLLDGDPAARGGVVVQGLDLRELADAITGIGWSGTTFLGCRMSESAELHVISTGATVFPPFAGLPFEPYRGELYTPSELAHDDLDTRIYTHQAQWRNSDALPILEALAQRILDHAIDDALAEFLADHERVVAIMGGHGLLRSDPTYRTVVTIARELTLHGYLVVTGGGPGAMEAGNLGAWLAAHDARAVDDALQTLSGAAEYTSAEYARAAEAVCERFPDGRESLAIPTWFYGHEPTNAFATAVAKYFSNSIREDGLLAIATHGVVYTPGAAGTVQEVFMDATQNHYGTFDLISPMVFVDSSFWADDRLAAPLLLRQLADGRPYAKLIAVLDDPVAVVEFIEAHPPRPA